MTAAANPLNTPANARFDVCVERLLRTEGGFVNHRADRGGATFFGISLRFLVEKWPDPVVRSVVGHDERPVAADVAALGRADAIRLYRQFFWEANRCGALPAPLDAAVFDQCVNGGGAVLLQEALNLYFHGALAVDGAIGAKTLALAAAAAADPRCGVGRLVISYRSLAENRYRAIARRDKSQAVFLAGWLARARSLGDV